MRRDAAALACVCRAASAVAPTSKWRSAVRVGPGGAVLEPASGAFDVTVAPGEDVQAAVDRCPPGGSVLLLPGSHEGPLELGPQEEARDAEGEEEAVEAVDKEVHVFGRGRATLWTAGGAVVISRATKATLDGLAVRCEAGGVCGLWIPCGGLRLQACDITRHGMPPLNACVSIDGGDPVLASCR